jgi:hypothetical protein
MRYRGFGRPTGLRASYLVFAAGTFGTHWQDGAKPDEVRRMGPVRKCQERNSTRT